MNKHISIVNPICQRRLCGTVPPSRPNGPGPQSCNLATRKLVLTIALSHVPGATQIYRGRNLDARHGQAPASIIIFGNSNPWYASVTNQDTLHGDRHTHTHTLFLFRGHTNGHFEAGYRYIIREHCTQSRWPPKIGTTCAFTHLITHQPERFPHATSAITSPSPSHAPIPARA